MNRTALALDLARQQIRMALARPLRVDQSRVMKDSDIEAIVQAFDALVVAHVDRAVTLMGASRAKEGE